MGSGPGVVEGAVGGSDGGAEVGSEGPELEAADLAADESSGSWRTKGKTNKGVTNLVMWAELHITFS